MNMVEIEIAEKTHCLLEIIALTEDLTPNQVIDLMVREWPGTDTLANRADFATPENWDERTAKLAARLAAKAAIKGELQ
jgi:hypothetical protein